LGYNNFFKYHQSGIDKVIEEVNKKLMNDKWSKVLVKKAF
jgi:hypothetical protein